MRIHFPLFLLAAMFAGRGAWAQRLQNMDISFLAGPASIIARPLAGSNVTLNGHTSLATSIVYGYQMKRISAASLWLELSPITALFGLGTASIPGSVNDTFMTTTAGVRLVVPLQSRVSAYGVLGGGVGLFYYPSLLGGQNTYLLSNSTLHGVFLVGGGVAFRLNRYISIRAEARDFITGAGLSGSTGRNHVLPLFGVAFHF
jgi:hypothetical protein